MKNTLKISIIYACIILLTQPVFSQDYYTLSQDFFKDTNSNHVNFVKKAIQEHHAEQLVIDYYNVISDNKKT